MQKLASAYSRYRDLRKGRIISRPLGIANSTIFEGSHGAVHVSTNCRPFQRIDGIRSDPVAGMHKQNGIAHRIMAEARNRPGTGWYISGSLSLRFVRLIRFQSKWLHLILLSLRQPPAIEKRGAAPPVCIHHAGALAYAIVNKAGEVAQCVLNSTR